MPYGFLWVQVTIVVEHGGRGVLALLRCFMRDSRTASRSIGLRCRYIDAHWDTSLIHGFFPVPWLLLCATKRT